ncbi:MAG TPA: GTPase Era [Aggregatilineaceae bacterium]|nr:GTPase Era [Aggregatilineaceae bacterium]
MTDQPPDDLLNAIPPLEELPPGHKSGFVAVIGRPNVGKSTLMNALLGEKVAIVSPKPQTTRLRQLGIYTRDDAQVVFVDTPGIHNPRTPLGEFMVTVALDALKDADVILFVADLSEDATAEDRQIADLVRQAQAETPALLVLNKVDLVDSPDRLQRRVAEFRGLVPDADWLTTVATTGEGAPQVLEHIIGKLPEGPRYYPADQLSDTAMRDIVAEIIREKVLLNLEQEVPHGVATVVEEYKQRSDDMTYIHATIYVERDTHKGIVIGKKGQMLKTISQQAREEIEAFVGSRVYLELWVKVLKNWRRDERSLRQLGYRINRDL